MNLKCLFAGHRDPPGRRAYAVRSGGVVEVHATCSRCGEDAVFGTSQPRVPIMAAGTIAPVACLNDLLQDVDIVAVMRGQGWTIDGTSLQSASTPQIGSGLGVGV